MMNKIIYILLVMRFFFLPSLYLGYNNFNLADCIFILAFLLMLLNIRNIKISFDKKVLIAFLMFSIGFLLGLFKAYDLEVALIGFIQNAFIFFILLPVLQLGIRNQKIMFQLSMWFALGVIINSLILNLNYIGNINLFSLVNEGWNGRYSLGTYGPNIYARLFCIAIIIYVHQLLNSKELMLKKLLRIFFIVNLTISLLLTGSLSGIILCLIGVSLIIALNLKSKISLKRIVYGAILLIVFILLLSQTEVMKVNFYDKTFQRFESIGKNDSSLSERTGLIREGIQNIDENLIFGKGYNNYHYTSSYNRQIHNVPLLNLLENGVFGAIGFLMLYLIPLSYTNILKSNLSFIYVIGVIVLLADMMQPNSYHRYLWVWILIIIVYKNNRLNKEGS